MCEGDRDVSECDRNLLLSAPSLVVLGSNNSSFKINSDGKERTERHVSAPNRGILTCSVAVRNSMLDIAEDSKEKQEAGKLGKFENLSNMMQMRQMILG